VVVVVVVGGYVGALYQTTLQQLSCSLRVRQRDHSLPHHACRHSAAPRLA
jgi:hypothetical protein